MEQGSTLLEVLLHLIIKYVNNGLPIAPESELYAFVAALATGLARIVVFYLGVAVCAVLVTPALNLIAGAVLRSARKKHAYNEYGEKRKKGFLSRLTGAGVRGLRYFLIFILVSLPLFGPF